MANAENELHRKKPGIYWMLHIFMNCLTKIARWQEKSCVTITSRRKKWLQTKLIRDEQLVYIISLFKKTYSNLMLSEIIRKCYLLRFSRKPIKTFINCYELSFFHIFKRKEYLSGVWWHFSVFIFSSVYNTTWFNIILSCFCYNSKIISTLNF